MTKNTVNAFLKNFPYHFLRTYAYRQNKKTGKVEGRATVVVFMKDNQLYYGWSVRNWKDQFNKKMGTFVALKRASAFMTHDINNYPVIDLSPEFDELNQRALRYFKQLSEGINAY